MNEQFQSNLVKKIRLGKRERFADKTSQSLTQGVIPTLNMSRLTGLFAHGLMIGPKGAKNGLISLPKVAEGGALSIRLRDPRPQAPAAFFAAIPDKIGHNLSGPPTEGYPDPSFIVF